MLSQDFRGIIVDEEHAGAGFKPLPGSADDKRRFASLRHRHDHIARTDARPGQLKRPRSVESSNPSTDRKARSLLHHAEKRVFRIWERRANWGWTARSSCQKARQAASRSERPVAPQPVKNTRFPEDRTNQGVDKLGKRRRVNHACMAGGMSSSTCIIRRTPSAVLLAMVWESKAVSGEDSR